MRNMVDKSTENQLNKNGKPQGMHPNSRVNLDRGRVTNHRTKKDCSITRILKDMANDVAVERWLEVEDKGKGLSWRQAVAKRMWIEATRGNAKVQAELLDRLEGKVTQPIAGENGQPIKTEIIVSSETAKKLTKAILNGEGT